LPATSFWRIHVLGDKSAKFYFDKPLGSISVANTRTGK